MKDKKRLSLNIVAQMVSFSVQFGLNFFLTPFIVGKLGSEAFGFIGLANNFVTYAQILTVALNSMAGRYIAIEYHQEKMKMAKSFYSSVFYANMIMAIIIGGLSIICCLYLEALINISPDLLFDVKMLFLLMMGNFIISLIFSVLNVATFIKNRLDLVAVRSIISNILRVLIITVAFSFFAPKLWYVGCAAVVSTLYISFVNYQYKVKLTPELTISTKLYKNTYVKTVVKSGIWNTVSRLSNVLEQGFDLLLANLFISGVAMGYLSITKQIPFVVLALIGTIGSAFAPSLTKAYAKDNKEELIKEILVSVKMISFFSIIPLSFLFVFSDIFYNLWLPGQNSEKLYHLTIIGVIYFPVLLSMEGTQNLWPVMDKVKTYSIVSVSMSLIIFVMVFVGIRYVDYSYRVYYLVSVSSFFNFIFALFFIPQYAASCLSVKKTFFYPYTLKVILSLSLVVLILMFVKDFYEIDSWTKLISFSVIDAIICIIIGSAIILNRSDRLTIYRRLKIFS